MTSRRLNKSDRFFLVEYLSDLERQVRSKGFIRTETEITNGRIYPVQWGRSYEVDPARIIAHGTEREMRDLYKEGPRPKKIIKSLNDQPKRPLEKTKACRNLTKTANVTKTGKRVASVVTVVTPEKRIREEAVTDVLDVTDETESPRASTSKEENPDTCLPSLTSPVYSHFRQRRDDPNMQAMESSLRQMANEIEKLRKANDQTNKMLHSLVEEVKDIRKGLSVENTNHVMQPVLPTTDPAETDASPVEEDLFLDGHTLGEMKRDSVSVGNFAAKLVMHFFPELFGVTNRRFLYNWNGGGQLNKLELDPARKRLIRTYVTRYYPEVSPEATWRMVVTPKINELLRRKPKQPHMRNIQPPVRVEPNVSTQEPYGQARSYVNL